MEKFSVVVEDIRRGFVHRATMSSIRHTKIFGGLTRNIYLHRGPRISGLKRDPSQSFVNREGLEYGDVKNNVKYIQEFLSDKYKINDDLALQVITHKSFNNGIKPYNEKLSAMGSKILNLALAKKVISSGTNKNDLSINNHNLDILGQPISKELTGRLALGIFAKIKKLNTIMFWNSYGQQLSFEDSGELKVSAQMVYALVGAINFTYGKKVAEQFIDELIFPTVEGITKDIVSKADS